MPKEGVEYLYVVGGCRLGSHSEVVCKCEQPKRVSDMPMRRGEVNLELGRTSGGNGGEIKSRRCENLNRGA